MAAALEEIAEGWEPRRRMAAQGKRRDYTDDNDQRRAHSPGVEMVQGSMDNGGERTGGGGDEVVGCGKALGRDGAFDEAVKGVDDIIHSASSLTMEVENKISQNEPLSRYPHSRREGDRRDPQCRIEEWASEEWVQGVKSVVFTSSLVAVLHRCFKGSCHRREDSWNEAAVKECAEKGKDPPPWLMFHCGWGFTELAAVWEFYEEPKSEIPWDITSLTPPLIVGPLVHEVTTPEGLDSSSKIFYGAVVRGVFWKAHIWSLEVPDAVLPAKGVPGGTKVRNTTFDATKERRILGLNYKTLKKTVKDTLADYGGL
ncbi:hypothetical protein GLOTRDRAFT_130672 [Gloeophyllum trabeum ATCC 11539]|uniref:Uncharacterized protein n=1 Tax=Gloeophyllum trabeum (strain ATCC 11539 / FP-39264 / Madison 617) TaxID=670483 RepID=S7RNF7_GLOTA|nr:uncharacterized protein GLOTRDRAFT_130672 [Gloeophyllum trabeum ATCC 11539]EPQ54304.1 hypothetical protein GLOTRDRAFT_130672 [Gloeophyllum trabeum ATCC 11539]